MKKFKNVTHGFLSILVAILLFSFQNVSAQGDLVTVKSSMNYDKTIAALKKGVASADMMVISEIDHGKILSMTGLSINAESMFIGNPNVGKQAFEENMAVGLSIPIRVNIYEEKGVTYINYFKPSSELSHFKGSKVKMIGQEMDKNIQMLTGMVAK